LVLQHASQVSSCWSYAHDKFEEKVFIENVQDWDELVQRMANPNMTRFKPMRMDEQVEMIEKLDQEALRAREEIRAVETKKAQRRGLFLTLEAQLYRPPYLSTCRSGGLRAHRIFLFHTARRTLIGPSNSLSGILHPQ
jgi:hypothetical protein